MAAGGLGGGGDLVDLVCLGPAATGPPPSATDHRTPEATGQARRWGKRGGQSRLGRWQLRAVAPRQYQRPARRWGSGGHLRLRSRRVFGPKPGRGSGSDTAPQQRAGGLPMPVQSRVHPRQPRRTIATQPIVRRPALHGNAANLLKRSLSILITVHRPARSSEPTSSLAIRTYLRSTPSLTRSWPEAAQPTRSHNKRKLIRKNTSPTPQRTHLC